MPENLLASDWLAKGLVLADSKEYEKAVMAFNQAIGAFPQCAEAWRKRRSFVCYGDVCGGLERI